MQVEITRLADVQAESLIGVNDFQLSEREIAERIWPAPETRPTAQQPMLLACLQGDYECVEQLIANDPALAEEHDEGGVYGVHLALANGHLRIVDLLLNVLGKGVSSQVDHKDRGALHYAVRCRAVRIVKRLVEEVGSGPTRKYNTDDILDFARLAARSGSVALLRYFIDTYRHMRDAPSNVGSPEELSISTQVTESAPSFIEKDDTPNNSCEELNGCNLEQNLAMDLMHEATTEDRLDTFVFVLKAFNNELTPAYRSELGFMCAANAATRCLAYLVQEHVVTRKEILSQNLIHESVEHGAKTTLEYLHSIGYNVVTTRERFENRTPFLTAVCLGEKEIVMWLLKTFANVANPPLLAAQDQDQYNALALSCYSDHLELFKYFYDLRSRDNPNSRQNLDSPHHTVPLLVFAAQKRALNICKWLLASHISTIDAEDEHGNTALLALCKNLSCLTPMNEPEHSLLQHLIDCGANLRHVAHGAQWTAFAHAVNLGDIEAIKILATADPELIYDVCQYKGKPTNMLRLAIAKGNLQVVEWLVENDPHRLSLFPGNPWPVWPDNGLGSLQVVQYIQHSSAPAPQRDDNAMELSGPTADSSSPNSLQCSTNPHILPALEDLTGTWKEFQSRPHQDLVLWLHARGVNFSNSVLFSYALPEPQSVEVLAPGLYPLTFQAVLGRDLQLLKVLVEKCKVPVSSPSAVPILKLAAARGDLEIFKYLLSITRDVAQQQHEKEQEEEEFSMKGILPSIAPEVAPMQQAPRPRDSPSPDVNMEWDLADEFALQDSILALALRLGHMSIVECIVNDCEKNLPDCVSGAFIWPLIAEGGNVELWKWAEERLTYRPLRRDPLLTLEIALTMGHGAMVDHLLERFGWRLSDIDASHGHWVEICGDQISVEIVEIAYRRGERMVFQNSKLQCVLHAAVLHLRISILRQLRSLGISLTTKDSMGNTALHWAVSTGYLGTIQWLMSHGLSLYTPNHQGQTPLHLAIALADPAVVQFLLELDPKHAFM